MAASMQSRVERLQTIISLLPTSGGMPQRGLSLAQLAAKLEGLPGSCTLSRRSLQRDLAELLRDGSAGVSTDVGPAPLYFRLEDDEDGLDDETWQFLLQQLKCELENRVSDGQLAKLFERLHLPEALQLDDSRLRILPDSLRLQPARIDYKVLAEVLRALKAGNALQVSYMGREGKRSEPVLHPQGLLQRGPRIYLYALKNEETSDRMYALDRMISASMLPQPARALPGFDLDQRVRDGRADFANGEIICLKAQVRGYIEQLLYDCPLGDNQQLVPLEQGGSLLTVDIPASGQLLRWVLAGGENIVVHEPEIFRDVVVGQVRRLGESYR